MAPSKISLRGVTKAFGPKQVLRGIDLDVTPGESMVVIGGSGTGKSVLLKCILGLMQPDHRQRVVADLHDLMDDLLAVPRRLQSAADGLQGEERDGADGLEEGQRYAPEQGDKGYAHWWISGRST